MLAQHTRAQPHARTHQTRNVAKTDSLDHVAAAGAEHRLVRDGMYGSRFRPSAPGFRVSALGRIVAHAFDETFADLAGIRTGARDVG